MGVAREEINHDPPLVRVSEETVVMRAESVGQETAEAGLAVKTRAVLPVELREWSPE